MLFLDHVYFKGKWNESLTEKLDMPITFFLSTQYSSRSALGNVMYTIPTDNYNPKPLFPYPSLTIYPPLAPPPPFPQKTDLPPHPISKRQPPLTTDKRYDSHVPIISHHSTPFPLSAFPPFRPACLYSTVQYSFDTSTPPPPPPPGDAP